MGNRETFARLVPEDPQARNVPMLGAGEDDPIVKVGVGGRAAEGVGIDEGQAQHRKTFFVEWET